MGAVDSVSVAVTSVVVVLVSPTLSLEPVVLLSPGSASVVAVEGAGVGVPVVLGDGAAVALVPAGGLLDGSAVVGAPPVPGIDGGAAGGRPDVGTVGAGTGAVFVGACAGPRCSESEQAADSRVQTTSGIERPG